MKLFTFLLALSLLAGCSAPVQPTSSLVAVPPASNTPIPSPTYTKTIIPATQTSLPATATPSPQPSTATPSPTATAQATETPTALTATPAPAILTTSNPGITLPAGTPGATSALPGSVPGSVNIYLIRQKTNGPLCGDSAIAVGTGVKRSGDIAKDVEAALNQLLAIGSPDAGDLYNPIGRSKLKVTESYFDPDGGLATVRIIGPYKQPKDPCDNTRVRAQVWATVKQFPEVIATNIYLNGVPFGDKLSNGK